MNDWILWMIIGLLALVWLLTWYVDLECRKSQEAMKDSPWPSALQDASEEREWWQP
jgi:hypothetical protein